MLVLNTALVLVHPLPDTVEESFAANRVAIGSFLCQESLNHILGSDARVIFARHPQGIIAFHSMVANEYIFDGGGNGVAQVQRTGHVGWGHADYKRWTSRIAIRLEVAALFPETVPFALNSLWFIGFW